MVIKANIQFNWMCTARQIRKFSVIVLHLLKDLWGKQKNTSVHSFPAIKAAAGPWELASNEARSRYFTFLFLLWLSHRYYDEKSRNRSRPLVPFWSFDTFRVKSFGSSGVFFFCFFFLDTYFKVSGLPSTHVQVLSTRMSLRPIQTWVPFWIAWLMNACITETRNQKSTACGLQTVWTSVVLSRIGWISCFHSFILPLIFSQLLELPENYSEH